MIFHLGAVRKSVECDICGHFSSFVVYSVEGAHGWACSEECFNLWIFKYGVIGNGYVVVTN